MKRALHASIIAVMLFVALAIPLGLAAQQAPAGSKLDNQYASKDTSQRQSAATSLANLPLDAQASVSAQLAKLTASDGAAFDYLGYSTAISGDTVVVGIPLATIGSNIAQGAVYVFVKPPSGWANMTETAKLTASDGGVRSEFGLPVSISGDMVVVGAPLAMIGSNIAQGAAYVFVKPASGWDNMTETAKLTASDGAAIDALGWTVSVGGNLVVAKSLNRAAVYVFVEPASGWTNMTETAVLSASDGVHSDFFGSSVSISGNTVVVGAPDATTFGFSQFQGAAYVFVEPASGWANMTETAKLTASNGAYADYLGSSVSISGNTIVVGAPGTGGGRGAAYVFVEPASGWANTTETAELTGGEDGDLLGFSVAISGNVVVAGAPRWPARDVQGAAYVFAKPPSGWKSTSSFNAKLTASDGADNDYFGYSVFISGTTIVSGAHGATIGSNSQQGAAYILGCPHLPDALASPIRLAVQDQQQNKQQPRYKLVDMGTFGGPQSYLSFGASVLNNRGVVAGYADSPTPDPFPSFCFNPDCFVSHVFQWQNGVLTDLGTLAAGWSSSASWISDTGEIAGISQNGAIDPLVSVPEFRAVLWQNGTITDLGTLEGGYESFALAVNNSGQVVGPALNTVPDNFCLFAPGFCTTQTRAFLWQNGVMQDLGTLGGPDAFAVSVNEPGQVAGFSYTNYIPNPITGTPQIDPFLWEKGKMIDLGTFGGPTGFANSLNYRGQVVGQMDLAESIDGIQVFHPFLWDRGTLKDLGTFYPPLGFGVAFWINDAGEAVGFADNLINDFATLWKDGARNNLGTVAGDFATYAHNINSKGQVVGSSKTIFEVSAHAFLWEQGGPIVDLNTLVPSSSGAHLTDALSVNERGEIGALGLLANGNMHAFLLVPCGENHPGVAGCDNSLVEGSATTGVGPAPARPRPTSANQSPGLRGMANRTLRPFGRRLMPWYRGLGAQPQK